MLRQEGRGGFRRAMTRAIFRFYEELNSHLRGHRRKSDSEVEFEGQPTVRELIEATGVPSEEVDLILADGESVGFGHIPKEGERISVYPVFESLNIEKATRLPGRPLRALKFVLEADLADLSAYMKACGHDVHFQAFISRSELIAISRKEKRIILTTDPQLLKSEEVTHAILLPGTTLDGQLQRIMAHLDIRPRDRLHARTSLRSRKKLSNGRTAKRSACPD